MPRRNEPALTEEQLRLAMRHLWRPGWPDDMAAVLKDPQRGPCVRGLARQFLRERPPVAAPRLSSLPPPHACPPVPPTPTAPPPSNRHRRGPAVDSPDTLGAWPRRRAFDARRAAANDFDDDDDD